MSKKKEHVQPVGEVEGLRDLAASEIISLSREEDVRGELAGRARKLHHKYFSEEYDFYYDDSVDSKMRSRGKCPMHREYIEEMNQRRAGYGVPPLTSAGLAPEGGHSDRLCEQWALEEFAYSPELRLPPDDRCLVCGRRHAGQDGPRILAAGALRVQVLPRAEAEKTDWPEPYLLRPLGTNADSVLVLTGFPDAEKLADKAVASLRELRRPAFCQPCTGRTLRNSFSVHLMIRSDGTVLDLS